ncbi:MAG: hypothetical protein ABJQ70_19100 [Roseobacter sp.]
MYKLFTYTDETVAPASTTHSPPAIATRPKKSRLQMVCNPLPDMVKSNLSQKSLVAKYMALDPEARDAFEERAAILEYDAGLSRAEAERQAFIEVMDAYRDG